MPHDRPKPFIATPSYDGRFCTNYLVSVLELRAFLHNRDIEHEFFFLSESLIVRARNDCVANFLETDCTHLFFIDADIGFEPEAFYRLLTAGYDLAAGVYPIKRDAPSFPIDAAAVKPEDGRGFAEANEAPTGFMCVARGVFEKMREAGIGKSEYFDTMRLDDDYLSEDYAFCHRWRSIGGSVFVDVLSDLTHTGTKTYSHDFQRYLRDNR